MELLGVVEENLYRWSNYDKPSRSLHCTYLNAVYSRNEELHDLQAYSASPSVDADDVRWYGAKSFLILMREIF
jgi:hypothetical protein